MPSLTVMLIRHAEKPEEAWPGPGLTVDGGENEKSLVVRGWQRAGAWSALFGAGLGGADYPKPDIVYAADPSRGTAADGDEPSQRPYQTATPLTARLHAGGAPVKTYAVGQEDALVAEILGRTGVVLVCWEHKAIAKKIVPTLLGGQAIDKVPKKWDGARFDVVFRFDRDGAGKPWQFKQLCPCLMSGDSDQPMPIAAE